MTCKKCGNTNYVKAGKIKGEQRYKCTDCGCQYVPTRQRGSSERDKLTSVWLYSHGFSFRTIDKFFKVTPKAIYDWVRMYALKNYMKPEPAGNLLSLNLMKCGIIYTQKRKSLNMEGLLPRYPSTYRLGVRRAR